MTRKEAKALVIKYSHPYRNSVEGLLVSATIFDAADPDDAGILFDAVCEHAERLIGSDVDVAPAPRGWLRIVPKQEDPQLITVQ